MCMRIQSVQNYYAKPAFTSWKRDVLNKDNEIVNRNDTMLYRGDLDWNSFVKFANKKYRDVDKVNVYDYACSDGSEAYTFLISMFNNIPIKDTKKFLPVLAYDIDNNAIKKAKSGELSISEEEKLRFAINSNYDLETFFDKNRYFNLYFPKTILSKNVEFDVADIQKHYKKIKPDNTIVIARNFWPYLPYSARFKLAENLYDKLGENSMVVIGNYDATPHFEYDYGVGVILAKAGFKKSIIDNVYEK